MDIWSSLKKGNERFIKSAKFTKQRALLGNSQNPNCVVLSCSDSRVPPEIIFAQNLGKLFVVRVAGQIVDDVVVDSIEFAVGNFDVSSIIVLGHANCGAVIGAIEHLKINKGKIDIPGRQHLNAVLIPIETAIMEAGIDFYAPNAVELAIQANVSYMVKQLLSRSSKISEAVKSGKLTIIGSEFDIRTGQAKQLFTIQK